jgi:hypothetical protein
MTIQAIKRVLAARSKLPWEKPGGGKKFAAVLQELYPYGDFRLEDDLVIARFKNEKDRAKFLKEVAPDRRTFHFTKYEPLQVWIGYLDSSRTLGK